jgi:hypothetical protein
MKKLSGLLLLFCTQTVKPTINIHLKSITNQTNHDILIDNKTVLQAHCIEAGYMIETVPDFPDGEIYGFSEVEFGATRPHQRIALIICGQKIESRLQLWIDVKDIVYLPRGKSSQLFTLETIEWSQMLCNNVPQDADLDIVCDLFFSQRSNDSVLIQITINKEEAQ